MLLMILTDKKLLELLMKKNCKKQIKKNLELKNSVVANVKIELDISNYAAKAG